ncbi:MAG: hypothetical protein AB7P23_02825 [Amphiplicatus sp.]
MADGAATATRRRSKADYALEADPRFADKAPDRAPERGRGFLDGGKPKKRPKIAFTGEEYGFGYQATTKFLEDARARRTVFDGGRDGLLNVRTEREFDTASKNERFDYAADICQPLRTKELALMAVKQGTADFAIVPFYHPYAGYDFESLRALSKLGGVLAVEQIEATDDLCLAVHESQLYDLIQSAHPGTGFSALQRRFRKSWGPVDSGSGNSPGTADAEMPRAGLPIDMADQKLIRDRIDLVFAGPEAARRCKSKLDGLKAIGVDIREMPQMVEPHRELARLARSSTNTARQTNTFFDPITNETRFFSTLGAEAQSSKLFGMVLPYEVAMRSSDYVIIDHKFDDAPAEKTRFMAVEINRDDTLTEDAYRTTDARTRYWFRRLRFLAHEIKDTNWIKSMASFILLAGLILVGVGAAGVAGWQGVAPVFKVTSAAVALGDWGALVIGALLTAAALVLALWPNNTPTERGVRVMLRFRRDDAAASIGDVENFLRNYAVRHAVVRLNEDSEAGKPADIMLDVEFDAADFDHSLFRRIKGPVANGALKLAFARWKDRGTLVLAAMPYGLRHGNEIRPTRQLPKHAPRRWWNEGLSARLKDAAETWHIRLSRLLFWAALIAVPAYFIWRALAANGS